MAKIAVTSDRDPGSLRTRPVARGDGWSVSEVTCTFGPQDHPFEEQHSSASIAIVASGRFQYRSRAGDELMTPRSLMLINPGECFECGHKHGTGDRCISFSYAPEFFNWIEVAPRFRALRIPPIRALAPLIAHASAAMAGAVDALCSLRKLCRG